jgi:hypothetical protein
MNMRHGFHFHGAFMAHPSLRHDIGRPNRKPWRKVLRHWCFCNGAPMAQWRTFPNTSQPRKPNGRTTLRG